jgi:hypothetical protein
MSLGPEQNPKASELAKKYNMDYDDVVQWFNGDYSTQDIERAFQMGDEMDAEVSDVLAMLDAGMDWHMIRKALDAMPDIGDDDDDDTAYGESPKQRRKSTKKKK